MLSPGTLELIITNIGFIASAVLSVCLGSFVLYKNPRKNTHILMFLAATTAAVFLVSHVIGINLTDPKLSRIAFMFNMVTLLTVCFNTHLVLVLTGKYESQKKTLFAIYAVGIILIGLFLAFPYSFMRDSIPVLYFPNYYSPGPLYNLDNLFFFIVIVYFLYHLYQSYRPADPHTRNRLKYFILAFTYAYVIGSIPLLPAHGIGVDPIISIFMGLWTIPLAYGIIKEDLFDIRVIAKRAVIYFSLVVASTLGLVLINVTNIFLLETYQNFPIWILPLVSSLFGIGVGVGIWKHIRESDLLKYEFINVVTHKFRTPMTYIKFSVDELREGKDEETKKNAVDRVEMANEKLLELTNLLVQASQSADGDTFYTMKEIDLNELVENLLITKHDGFVKKSISLQKNLDQNLHKTFVDPVYMKSVLQIILENAITYSRTGGIVTVTTKNERHSILYQVADNGIGISHEQQPLIFSQFFRTPAALSADTEGLGLGLFIAKKIVEQHGGKIWMESEGIDKGSTFFVRLKAVQSS